MPFVEVQVEVLNSRLCAVHLRDPMKGNSNLEIFRFGFNVGGKCTIRTWRETKRTVGSSSVINGAGVDFPLKIGDYINTIFKFKKVGND